MNGKYLLDTNIVIAIFAQEASVLQRLKDAAEVFIPSVVIGELYYGAFKSRRVVENILRTEEFASRNAILACDAATAAGFHTKSIFFIRASSVEVSKYKRPTF